MGPVFRPLPHSPFLSLLPCPLEKNNKQFSFFAPVLQSADFFLHNPQFFFSFSATSYSHIGFTGDFGDSLEKGHSTLEKHIQLTSLVFMNPEYEMDTFMNDYVDIRMVSCLPCLFHTSGPGTSSCLLSRPRFSFCPNSSTSGLKPHDEFLLSCTTSLLSVGSQFDILVYAECNDLFGFTWSSITIRNSS